MLGPKIKVDRDLYDRLARCAETAGYSSADEFIRHTLEKAAAALETANSEEEIRKRLQGLGYLD
jgi:metal-responsive CopG/Arc/MetJ family transcriptional regulator